MTNFEPKTYWEKRTLAMEGAVERLFDIVANNLPSTYPIISQVAKEWDKIRGEIERDYNNE